MIYQIKGRRACHISVKLKIINKKSYSTSKSTRKPFNCNLRYLHTEENHSKAVKIKNNHFVYETLMRNVIVCLSYGLPANTMAILWQITNFAFSKLGQ